MTLHGVTNCYIDARGNDPPAQVSGSVHGIGDAQGSFAGRSVSHVSNEMFVTLYNFLNSATALSVGITRRGYCKGTTYKGIQDAAPGMDYWDGTSPAGNNAWAIYEFTSGNPKFWILLQYGTSEYGSGMGFLYPDTTDADFLNSVDPNLGIPYHSHTAQPWPQRAEYTYDTNSIAYTNFTGFSDITTYGFQAVDANLTCINGDAFNNVSTIRTQHRETTRLGGCGVQILMMHDGTSPFDVTFADDGTETRSPYSHIKSTACVWPRPNSPGGMTNTAKDMLFGLLYEFNVVSPWTYSQRFGIPYANYTNVNETYNFTYGFSKYITTSSPNPALRKNYPSSVLTQDTIKLVTKLQVPESDYEYNRSVFTSMHDTHDIIYHLLVTEDALLFLIDYTGTGHYSTLYFGPYTAFNASAYANKLALYSFSNNNFDAPIIRFDIQNQVFGSRDIGFTDKSRFLTEKNTDQSINDYCYMQGGIIDPNTGNVVGFSLDTIPSSSLNTAYATDRQFPLVYLNEYPNRYASVGEIEFFSIANNCTSLSYVDAKDSVIFGNPIRSSYKMVVPWNSSQVPGNYGSRAGTIW